MATEQEALSEEIRRCLRCLVAGRGPGQPYTALCVRHQRKLDLLIPPCTDLFCTTCPPEAHRRAPADPALPQCDNPGVGHRQHVAAVYPDCLL